MHEFQTTPSMGRAYLRAILERKQVLPDGPLPEMRARLGPLSVDPGAVAHYREVVGGHAPVPFAYPQLLVTPMHVALLTRSEFPIRAMGLVHPRFSVRQLRPISAGEPVAFESWFANRRAVHNGVEFDIETRASVGDELVWESTAATFHRTGHERRDKRPEPRPDREDERDFAVPANAGRRFARVSGDANPVHLHPLTSKIFGYRQPIAHGWWIVGRLLSELGLDGVERGRLDVEFRRPVLLGANYRLAVSADPVITRFSIVDDAGKIRTEASFEQETS